jgi:hypothetical protein
MSQNEVSYNIRILLTLFPKFHRHLMKERCWELMYVQEKWTLQVISISKVLHHFQTCIKHFYRHLMRVRKVSEWYEAEESDIVNQISPLIKYWKHFHICSTFLHIYRQWSEKGGCHKQCKGEQWTLLNYIVVKSWSLALYHNPLDMLTIFQVNDVKADVDQTNREVRLHFFVYDYN